MLWNDVKNAFLPVNRLHKIKFERREHASECQTKEFKKRQFLYLLKCCFPNLILKLFSTVQGFCIVDNELKQCFNTGL